MTPTEKAVEAMAMARAGVAHDSGPECGYLFKVHWREFGEGYTNTARAALGGDHD